jgi:hypothetical protein
MYSPILGQCATVTQANLVRLCLAAGVRAIDATPVSPSGNERASQQPTVSLRLGSVSHNVIVMYFYSTVRSSALLRCRT